MDKNFQLSLLNNNSGSVNITKEINAKTIPVYKFTG